MQECAAYQEVSGERSYSALTLDKFHSVEFCVNGIEFSYQFRIWNIVPKSMCVLIREDSDILDRINVGDVLTMKYYGADSMGSPQYLETEIKHVTKDDNGRFRGHYLVGLAILSNGDGKSSL